MKQLNRIIRLFDQISPRHRRDAYWFLALGAIAPGIRSELLFPQEWLNFFSEYATLPVANFYGLLAPLLAFIVAMLAASEKKPARFLAVIPYILLPLADSSSSLSSLYAISAFAVLLYFALKGQVMSLPFNLFIVLLILCVPSDELLSWQRIILFTASVVVMRLAVEAVRQNLPLARQLGRENITALLLRTGKLWWPMLILIAIGLALGNRMTVATENFFYQQGYVTPYCAWDGGNDETLLPCPEQKQPLEQDEEEPSQALLLKESMLSPIRPAISENEKTFTPAMCTLWGNGPEQVADSAMRPFICPPNDAEQTQWPLTQVGFFTSADRSVEYSFNRQEQAVTSKLYRLDYQTQKKKAAVPGQAQQLFSVVPENTGMKTKSCDLLDVKCKAANMVISELNKAYTKKRAEAEGEFIGYATSRANDAEASYQTVRDDIEKALLTQLGQFERATRAAIERVHSGANILQQILMLWLVVAIIKSILFVFARVIFDKSTNIDVDLLDQTSTPKEGNIESRQEIIIPANYPRRIFYKANYQPLGPAPRFSIPQWRASLMSRLRFGAWNMSCVDMPLVESEQSLTFNSIQADYLIDWTLQEGEEVVFSYNNFVAMDDNIELRTVISLRVASLLLGRIVFHTARCKGKNGRLILRTQGKPATAEQVSQSIPAVRLVAWNRYARFSVDSHLTLVDIFLNGFNLRRSNTTTDEGPQGILVVEADARDGGIMVGTLRFAKNFLLPI